MKTMTREAPRSAQTGVWLAGRLRDVGNGEYLMGVREILKPSTGWMHVHPLTQQTAPPDSLCSSVSLWVLWISKAARYNSNGEILRGSR